MLLRAIDRSENILFGLLSVQKTTRGQHGDTSIEVGGKLSHKTDLSTPLKDIPTLHTSRANLFNTPNTLEIGLISNIFQSSPRYTQC